MITKRFWPFLVAALAVPLHLACGDDDADGPEGPCSVSDQSGCDEGLVCQEVAGGEPACFCDELAQTGCGDGLVCEGIVEGNSGCFAPVNVAGRVFELATDSPIEGARIVARDANGAAASGVAVSGADGTYTLAVPTRRDADGNPVEHQVTLRADATGYLTFPLAPRVALPVDTSAGSGEPLTVMNSATDIGLIALQETEGLGTVSGRVLAERPWGTLIVAGGAVEEGGGVTAIADRDGSYTVFNVPAGTVTVRGYKTGLNLSDATADVMATEETGGVDLESKGEAQASVSGKIEIVNPGGGTSTSVILAVAETFVPAAARGESPPGLRIGDITGGFRFDGVPDGTYVVLAAFENDLLVRDPDESIGGTEIVRVTVDGADVTIAESFKVTGSLDVVSPDAEVAVSGTPTFVWADDSGEDHYEVAVYDAFGTLVWENTSVPGVSGSKNVEVPYGGDALVPGTLYQFRARSIKRGGTSIATTEDLRGVFVYE